MKIGRTGGDAQNRMNESSGYLSERPILGFELKTDDAENWEKLLHGMLHLAGRHMPEAVGTEWFFTNPDELSEIVANGRAIIERLRDGATEAGE